MTNNTTINTTNNNTLANAHIVEDEHTQKVYDFWEPSKETLEAFEFQLIERFEENCSTKTWFAPLTLDQAMEVWRCFVQAGSGPDWSFDKNKTTPSEFRNADGIHSGSLWIKGHREEWRHPLIDEVEGHSMNVGYEVIAAYVSCMDRVVSLHVDEDGFAFIMVSRFRDEAPRFGLTETEGLRKLGVNIDGLEHNWDIFSSMLK